MTGGPEVHADRVVFRLADHGFTSVRLQQELQRPRSGPAFARADGGAHWELEYRRAQVDRMEYRIEADGDSICDPHNPLRAPGAFGDKSVVEFPGYPPPRVARGARPGPGHARRRAGARSGRRPTPTRASRSRSWSPTTAASTSASPA